MNLSLIIQLLQKQIHTLQNCRGVHLASSCQMPTKTRGNIE